MVLRTARLIAVCILPMAVAPAMAQQRPATSPQPQAAPAQLAVKQQQVTLTPEAMVLMIRTTLIALNQANLTNNYSVIRDLGTPAFQATTSLEQLSQSFTAFRAQRLDVSPVVVVTPQLTQAPAVDSQGNLRLVGVFPTQPLQLTFDLAFQIVDGRWRHSGLNVGTTPSPAAQQQQPAASPAKAPAPPAKSQPTVQPTPKAPGQPK